MATTLKIRTKRRTFGLLLVTVAATLVAGFAIPFLFADDPRQVEAPKRITLEDDADPTTPVGDSIQPLNPLRKLNDGGGGSNGDDGGSPSGPGAALDGSPSKSSDTRRAASGSGPEALASPLAGDELAMADAAHTERRPVDHQGRSCPCRLPVHARIVGFLR